MKECDLIMKGGITSGVVYPIAITELSKKYRFRNIGGTSAGAIGAVFAAAAEYRREIGDGDEGFQAIESLAEELGEDMQALFQPSPELAPLFELLIASISEEARCVGRPRVLFRAIRRVFLPQVLYGILLTVVLILLAFVVGSVWAGLLGIVLGLMLIVVLIAKELYDLVFRRLPQHDFGVCPGRTVGCSAKKGFSDWIADKIDSIAGRNIEGPPLTVGDLKKVGINVATMSTDLSSGRPYQLPLQTNIHYFSRREFEVLFPPRVVGYLCEKGDPRKSRASDEGVPDDLYRLPVGDEFPVLLVARMSLSFPGLIRAIPLWRPDYTRGSGIDAPLRRCLFSDGGISSNFPIHFFDTFLPQRPTFGIALGGWEPHHDDQRIDLPNKGKQSTSLPVKDVGGVGGFLFAILNTAKDWQDSMQSLLPGYAERIVTVRLDDRREGGLNLTMDKSTIKTLTDYGREAGETLTQRFRFTQHRYDRAVALLPAIEQSLEALADAYRAAPDATAEGIGYSDVLRCFDTEHYQNGAEWRADPFSALAEDLAKLGDKARELRLDPKRKCVREGTVPATDSQIRLVAIADRVPRNAQNATG